MESKAGKHLLDGLELAKELEQEDLQKLREMTKMKIEEKEEDDEGIKKEYWMK
ncbi:MAG: hypothetical protein Q8K92_02035 [Leadbetterella sp.]|nr:hypothetical protein [Leadbetterella sp.]